jgi:hypothetical protein
MRRAYRILVFDMGHVSAMELVEAESDEAAITQAKAIFPTEEREVWESNRFVIRLRGTAAG